MGLHFPAKGDHELRYALRWYPFNDPLGIRNQVTPADGRLITDFAPGRHEKVFMTFFGSTQDTWTLGGTDFTSDAFASHPHSHSLHST